MVRARFSKKAWWEYEGRVSTWDHRSYWAVLQKHVYVTEVEVMSRTFLPERWKYQRVRHHEVQEITQAIQYSVPFCSNGKSSSKYNLQTKVNGPFTDQSVNIWNICSFQYITSFHSPFNTCFNFLFTSANKHKKTKSLNSAGNDLFQQKIHRSNTNTSVFPQLPMEGPSMVRVFEVDMS